MSLLSRNGRMSFTELARQAGLSVSAVHQRVRRLETDGVITGYVALCDPQVIGLPLTAFVSIKPFDQSAPDDVPQRLEQLTAIEACHSVAGDENYILKVRVRVPGGPGGTPPADPHPRQRVHPHHRGALYERTRTVPPRSDRRDNQDQSRVNGPLLRPDGLFPPVGRLAWCRNGAPAGGEERAVRAEHLPCSRRTTVNWRCRGEHGTVQDDPDLNPSAAGGARRAPARAAGRRRPAPARWRS